MPRQALHNQSGGRGVARCCLAQPVNKELQNLLAQEWIAPHCEEARHLTHAPIKQMKVA